MAKIIKVRENTLSFVKYLPPNVELISRLSMFLLNESVSKVEKIRIGLLVGGGCVKTL